MFTRQQNKQHKLFTYKQIMITKSVQTFSREFLVVLSIFQINIFLRQRQKKHYKNRKRVKSILFKNMKEQKRKEDCSN